MPLLQKIVPQPGRITIVREADTSILKRARRSGLEITEETTAFEKKSNPFSLVVGVGESRVTDTGREIKTAVQPGDRVMVAQVGNYVELITNTGEVDYVYAVPFESIIAIVKWFCTCGWEGKNEPEGERCPDCGDTVPDAVRLATPDLAEVAEFGNLKL